MKRALLLAGAALAFALTAIPQDYEPQDEPTAPTACDTDSDCLLHCPPPADDPDCDGGPQDPTPARGNRGTQP